MMAFVFARYAYQLFPCGDGRPSVLAAYAAAVVAVMTGVNLLGLRASKWTQNLLSLAKYLGLAAICAAGLLYGGDHATQPAFEIVPTESSPLWMFGQAMIFVLFTFGGWNEMAYVGAEVRNPRKNIFRALFFGTVAITVIFLLANFAFLRALGLEGIRHSSDVAGDTLELALGVWGRRAIQVIILVTALGTIQGMIFTSSRIFYAMGQDYSLYAWLGRWSGRRDTPIHALLVQGAVATILILGFGWMKEGFESMVIFTTPVFWFFFALVAVSQIVLRIRHPEVERPFRTPLYPVLPLVFCITCLSMIYSSLSYAIEKQSMEAVWAIALILLGIAASFLRK
jgi:amino acid transporter